MNHLEPESTGPKQARSVAGDRYWGVFRETFQAFDFDQALELAAAMSFYAILSMGPLIVVLISIAGTILDPETAGRRLVSHVRNVAGDEAAAVTVTIVEHAKRPLPGGITMVVGVVTLLFGATGIFTQLQHSLNRIWKVRSPDGIGLWVFLRKRLTALLMVLCAESILLLLPLLTALVTAVDVQFVGRTPQIALVWRFVHLVVPIFVIALFFATIFKILPYTKVRWADVWGGAFGSALLFSLGQFLIGRYLTQSGVATAFGAAGSLVGFLVWIYYSALVLFLGAEFTKVYAHRFGSHAPPPTVAQSSQAPGA